MHRVGLLPLAFRQTCKRLGVLPTRFVCLVNVRRQEMQLVEPLPDLIRAACAVRKIYSISTSRFGIGQNKDSNRTPLGLHRIAEKVGGGWPAGATFKSRKMMGYTWKGSPGAAITHRILWLDGLEPGFNRGGHVDTFERYIYIHGTGEEPTLGRPASRGCIHVRGTDLLPLYDLLPVGTLIWIEA
jgi:lipoprotein-anchoring transpeptidase ErfK/SrfK